MTLRTGDSISCTTKSVFTGLFWLASIGINAEAESNSLSGDNNNCCCVVRCCWRIGEFPDFVAQDCRPVLFILFPNLPFSSSTSSSLSNASKIDNFCAALNPAILLLDTDLFVVVGENGRIGSEYGLRLAVLAVVDDDVIERGLCGWLYALLVDVLALLLLVSSSSSLRDREARSISFVTRRDMSVDMNGLGKSASLTGGISQFL